MGNNTGTSGTKEIATSYPVVSKEKLSLIPEVSLVSEKEKEGLD